MRLVLFRLALLAALGTAQEVEMESVGAVSLTPRVTKVYSSVTPKLRIQGEGFDGDGTNLHLEFVPPMPKGSYSVEVASETQLTVLIKGANRWPTNDGATETTLYASSLKNDLSDDPNKELLGEAVPVATVLPTPSIVKRDDKLLYMTGTVRLYVNGTGFRPKETMFVFDPPLFRDVDYVMEVKSPSVAMLTLKTGRKWRSDGAPGPLKIKRLTTGAGELRIDAKFGGVTVAEVQADLGAHGVTVETTSDKKVYQSSPSLMILGSGFNSTGTIGGGNTLRWANSLRGRGVNYTIDEAHSNQLVLKLSEGSKWRANPANLPGPLTLLAVNAGAGPVPVGATEAKKGRVVATVYADPKIKVVEDRVIARTLDHELWIEGVGFSSKGETEFDLETVSADGSSTTKLRPFADYLLVVFNSTHVRFWLTDGKAWAPEGDEATLRCVGLNTGAGKVPYVSAENPVFLAKVVPDAEHSTGASVTRTVTSQLLYETPARKKLTITGENLCSSANNKVVMPEDVKVGFSPEIDQGDVFTVTKVTPTQITLTLKNKKRWPIGTLKVVSLACDSKGEKVAEFAGGDGVPVASVLPDPTVEAHEDLVLYAHHSRRLVVRGVGFAIEDTELTLSPTAPDSYRVVESLEDFVALELVGDEASWVPEDMLPEDGTGVTLKVTKIDTGAGEVVFEDEDGKGGIAVATVRLEPEGDICDDSCEWANDGVCDDGTQPFLGEDDFVSNRGRRFGGFDDDYGGFRYGDDDDMYYGYGLEGANYVYDDYGYGFLRDFEDDDFAGRGSGGETNLAACLAGTDCTDCQPRGGDAWLEEAPEATCENTCSYARDGYCDDGRDGMPSYCISGTDCQDCGPVGQDNYTRYDDEFWDDDADNWYFEDDYWDDYMRSGLDDFYYYAEYEDGGENGTLAALGADGKAGKKKSGKFADDDDEVDGRLRSIRSQPNPFQIDPEVTSGGDSLASLLIAGVFVAVLSLAACGAMRATGKGKKGGCLPFVSAKAKEDTNRDLVSTWSEMTARQENKTKANVPITPDVTYSGSSS